MALCNAVVDQSLGMSGNVVVPSAAYAMAGSMLDTMEADSTNESTFFFILGSPPKIIF